MRFVRERLEVVTCYIPFNGEAVGDNTSQSLQKTPGKNHYPSNACFNVFWYQQPTWTPPFCKYLIEYYDTLKSLPSASEGASAVVRLSSTRQTGNNSFVRSSGSGFYLLPNTIITTSHVEAELERIGGKITAFSNAWNNSNSTILPTRIRTLHSGKTIKDSQLGNLFPVTYSWVGRDPITTKVGDFDYFDVTAMDFTTGSLGNKVFFIPSPRILQPNDEIISLSYPGDKHQQPPYSSSLTYVDWAPSESFLKDNIFNGYGKLCASVGTIMHPYKLSENGFVEKDENFRYDSSNQECLASSECLIYGSSGGVMISKFSQVYQIGEYTLVEFNAIHTGGEFVRCSDCLKESSSAYIISPPDSWRLCGTCVNNVNISFNNAITYSTSISVHSKPFVEFYSSVILPQLCKLPLTTIPDSLIEYCQMHQINIK
ncbi:predicted protein [Naegleria gruberi]|uniref:Predicted protein n=1 Tax=Naegleria gruberi TaxID=5762 RepID=D2V3R9_NAEGR|nr:uncharacterized protein NAEGRDRAFT_63466 [Naegleria gruberi]EFC48685.1 predicted protein [Naegleria gruberi]|eukprot:XP_002681429.1 predicted protein [Naegleria gruberi strain NEG-M]